MLTQCKGLIVDISPKCLILTSLNKSCNMDIYDMNVVSPSKFDKIYSIFILTIVEI